MSIAETHIPYHQLHHGYYSRITCLLCGCRGASFRSFTTQKSVNNKCHGRLESLTWPQLLCELCWGNLGWELWLEIWHEAGQTTHEPARACCNKEGKNSKNRRRFDSDIWSEESCYWIHTSNSAGVKVELHPFASFTGSNLQRKVTLLILGLSWLLKTTSCDTHLRNYMSAVLTYTQLPFVCVCPTGILVGRNNREGLWRSIWNQHL